MENEERFIRVLGQRDVLALAFGAMIGFGWVALARTWLQEAGSLGAIVAFLIGGLLVVFVGLTYSELVSAMPKAGGEHNYAWRAIGAKGAFAYLMVAISFLVLRRKEQEIERPFRAGRGPIIGIIAVVLSLGIAIQYLPGLPAGLVTPEWIIVGIWTIAGLIFATRMNVLRVQSRTLRTSILERIK